MTPYAPCPQCGSTGAEKMKFTWWGGLIGPRLMTHVKCGACAKQYNGKTGKDNTTNIAIYFVVVALIVFGLVLLMFGLLGFLMYSTSG